MKKIVISMFSIALMACSSNKSPNQRPFLGNENKETSSVVSNNKILNNSVYYDFDKYFIKDEYAEIININKEILLANPNNKVKIEGNTDDIGSVEYNLSLAQKRADSVKKALIINGVNKDQIETISNGKLKPIYPNNNSENRAKNRRSDIFYEGNLPSNYFIDQSLPEINLNNK